MSSACSHCTVVLLGLVSIFLIQSSPAGAQIQIGTLKGTVTDQAGALVPNAGVTLDNSLTGFHRAATTTAQGDYVFNDVPFNSYILRISVAGFEPAARSMSVHSNIPVIVDVKLSVAEASASVNIQADEALVRPDASGTETTVDESFIRRLSSAGQSSQLQKVVATTPGWRAENDGLLHVRGVDDGILYVIDGIPITDRLDVLSGNSYDTEAIRSLNVMTGNIPAEFGGRSGAVVNIQSKSITGMPPTGSLSFTGGSSQSRAVNATIGRSFGKKIGFFVTTSGNRSNRFIDPVDTRNFNNRGGTLRLNLRSDWHPTTRDVLLFTISVNGTDFHITNDLEQEIAGQRQRQELRDDSESVRWQRVWSSSTVTDVAYYRQSYGSRLFGSPFDTPLTADQDRRDIREGIIASLTRSLHGHTLKTGFEASRLSLREFFTFAVTDRAAAQEREISDAALEFNLAHPFVFRDRRVRGQFSGYIQDTFSPLKNLTIDAGLRYDHSSLLASDEQFSPRVGAVYYIRKTRTAIRGSFNRLFMPPQIENLLLSSSEQARRLSPFASNEGGGGEMVLPESVSAYEVGFAQDVFGFFWLDAAYWDRSFRNYDDPNVFFNTTIIFPNSVARGFARGVDVRVDVPERRGWSGYLSYGNSRIVQTGPLNGGLFLTNDFLNIGPGTRFIPDQDERNAASFGVTYSLRSKGLWASVMGKYESGVPLEVEADRLKQLRVLPGADLVNFERGRVKPWSVFDFSTGWEVLKEKRVSMQVQFDVQNIANRKFVYNFGNPFSGTHFGYPRWWGGRMKFIFR
jgi:outer membrane receptor protein involved in Fe transport